MKAVVTMDDAAPPAFDLPLATRLLPGAVSALAALLAVAHGEGFLRGSGALVALLHVQASLLALGAAATAAVAHARLSRWEARLAPQRAQARVRAGLLRDLWHMAAIGLVGPLALAVVVGWQSGDAQPLPGTLAVLGASLCAGFCAVHSWQGRAPRWLLPLALAALLFLLAAPGAVAAVSGDGRLVLLTLALTGAAAWRFVLAPQALAARVPALPLPKLPPWWRRIWAHRGWELVRYQQPYQTLSGRAVRPPKVNVALMALAWLPQFLAQAPHLGWLGWGQPYGVEYAAAGYGLWMLFIGAFAGAYLVAPTLHWRHRLAPGSLTPRRWARRLVWGSMLGYAAAISLGIALSVLANRLASRPLHADAWLLAMGDVLLASSFAVWQRGRYEGKATGFACVMGFGLAAFAVLAVLPLLGVTPQRGAVWLLAELALSVWLARSAIRAWAARDLNALA